MLFLQSLSPYGELSLPSLPPGQIQPYILLIGRGISLDPQNSLSWPTLLFELAKTPTFHAGIIALLKHFTAYH